MRTASDALENARKLARQILDGTINPNVGCDLIAEICRCNSWPHELVRFEALAHEQEGHEEFGFDAQNTAPLVLEACRELLSGEPQ